MVLPKIDVTDRIDPADVTRPEKTPLQKLRAKLDTTARAPNFSITETTQNDGTRIAQFNTVTGIYCLKEHRGQVDFSGINKLRQGMAQRPAGRDCR